jgi:hypothetical protein
VRGLIGVGRASLSIGDCSGVRSRAWCIGLNAIGTPTGEAARLEGPVDKVALAASGLRTFGNLITRECSGPGALTGDSIDGAAHFVRETNCLGEAFVEEDPPCTCRRERQRSQEDQPILARTRQWSVRRARRGCGTDRRRADQDIIIA